MYCLIYQHFYRCLCHFHNCSGGLNLTLLGGGKEDEHLSQAWQFQSFLFQLDPLCSFPPTKKQLQKDSEHTGKGYSTFSHCITAPVTTMLLKASIQSLRSSHWHKTEMIRQALLSEWQKKAIWGHNPEALLGWCMLLVLAQHGHKLAVRHVCPAEGSPGLG